jgi:hypothetical protein
MSTLKNIDTLEKLWLYTNQLHQKQYPQSKLKPIMAGGKLYKPRYMFVFINPTYKNVSSDADWAGERRPWTGTKYIWKIFNRAGHFDAALLDEINCRKTWDVDFANKVYGHLADRGFYFTNIVKWTGANADLPSAQKINLFLPILLREIELVQPKYIVTFGLLPFNALVGKKLKLAEYFDSVVKCGELKHYDLIVNERSYKVIPCYFPVGRGNPKRAVELLRLLPSCS